MITKDGSTLDKDVISTKTNAPVDDLEREIALTVLELIDEAELAVAPETVDMDQVGLNGTKEFKVVLLNTGTQDLAISSIVSTNPQFVLSASSFTIAPETASELVISFTEQNTEGTFNTIIQLSSNDSDEGYLEIPVTISVSGETSVVETVWNVHTFELQQNFPNPFNPSTKIPFQLPVKSHVRLAVFDVNGRMLEEPVNEELDSGPHVIAFHGTGLASGIYTCLPHISLYSLLYLWAISLHYHSEVVSIHKC